MPDNTLPNTITLRSGETVNVVWSSLGTGWDEWGQPIEYYFPSPTLDYLYPDVSLDIMYNIYQVDRRTGETSIIAEETLPSLGIDEGELYQRATYISVAEQLIQQGSLTEGQLASLDVQNYLMIRSGLMGRDPSRREFQWQTLSTEIERIATDPGFADYMKRIGAMGAEQAALITPEGEDITAQNIARLIRTKPTGVTETEWLQDIVKRLEPYYTEYGPRATYATGLMAQVIPALTGAYEEAQTRLGEIEAGAEQATRFGWLPSQSKMMTAQFGYKPPPPQAPLRDPFGPPAWDKLVAEARPERIARL